MKWSDEPYVRLYTRRTLNWIALSWQARAVFVLLLKEVDRSGQIEVGRHGIDGLARLLEMPADVVEVGVTQLVTESTIAFEGGLLTIPNFVEAQETQRPRTPAERMAAYRKRLDTGKSSRNGKETPLRSSYDDVTPLRNPPPSAVPSLTPFAGGAGGKARKAGAKTPPHPAPKGSELPEEWQPSPALLASLRKELGILTEGAAWELFVRRFIDWHRQATGRASKSRDWNAKLAVWARRDFHEGKLEEKHRTMSEPSTAASREKLAVDAPPEERKALADAARASVGLTKTGTHET